MACTYAHLIDVAAHVEHLDAMMSLHQGASPASDAADADLAHVGGVQRARHRTTFRVSASGPRPHQAKPLACRAGYHWG